MSLRVGTLNVHWTMRPKRMDEFVKLVFENKLDILVTQEGQSDAIQKFVNKLNEFDTNNKDYTWNHASVLPSFLCNSIITKYPISYENTADWKWREMQNEKSIGSKENRCAVMAKILIPCAKDNTTEISIMCTHLDHIDEDCRIFQLNHFLDNIMTVDNSKRKRTTSKTDENKENEEEKNVSKNIEYPDIICGDFNSLLRSDYDKKQWNKITSTRGKTEWEQPRSDLMYQLLIEKGYNDTLGTALKQKFYKQEYMHKSKKVGRMDWNEFDQKVNLPKWFAENFKIKKNKKGDKKNGDGNIFTKIFKSKKKNKDGNPEKFDHDKDEMEVDDIELDKKWNKLFFEYFKKYWKFTSRFETRIDYILVSDKMLNCGKWKLVDAGFVDTMQSDLTDHNLYWCEFECI